MTVDNFFAELEQIFAAQEDLTSKWHIEDWGEDRYENVTASPESCTLADIAAIQHFMNYSLWHVEDTARRKDVPPSVIADCKYRIDVLNQKRNNLIEKMDGAIIGSISRGLPPDAAEKYNTETMGMAIDRMSILALKIYHMREQTERSDASDEHIAKCARSLAQLTEQRETLSRSILDLAEDFFAGRKSVRPYYQHKMYNDNTLNPELYRKRM